MGRIRYKLKKFKNSGSAYNNFYYPKAVHLGTVGTDELAEMVSRRCTITKADVLGCLAALSEVMQEQVTNSMAVKLDGIGIFKACIHTKEMVEEIKDFNVNTCIKGYGMNFLPLYTIDASGKRTTKLLAGAGVTEADDYASGVNDTKKVGGKYVPIELVEKA